MKKALYPSFDAAAFNAALRDWYAKGARAMPWRGTTDPYRIWLAEVMLQQTTVAAVIPYYERFLSVLPTVETLAAADLDAVLGLWQGLGYYRRARMLHACAKVVVNDLQGVWPRTVEGLEALPGIGPYTAAAIASCAFDVPANVVDGNVERVVARVFEIATPLPAGKKDIRAAAAGLVDAGHPRIYANAMMELGATVCVPKKPRCLLCPVQALCGAFKAGTQERYPVRGEKKVAPERRGVAVVHVDGGRVWLRRRAEEGLLGGLWEVPNSGIGELDKVEGEVVGEVVHVFTHFKLTLEVRVVRGDKVRGEGAWFAMEDLPPLPNLMRKVLGVVLPLS